MAVKDGVRSPASVKLDEAIEAVLEGSPIVPDRSTFIDSDSPHIEDEMRWAADKGNSAVIVSPNGSTRIVPPEDILGIDAA